MKLKAGSLQEARLPRFPKFPELVLIVFGLRQVCGPVGGEEKTHGGTQGFQQGQKFYRLQV